MRLFVALDIDPAIRSAMARFLDGVKGFAPDARWVSPHSFHVTLKFIGEKSPAEADDIMSALAGVHGAPTTLGFRGTGYFPTAKAARVFWIGIEADPHLAELAEKVETRLEELRIPREDRAFSPHLTLARGSDARHPRGGSGNPRRRPTDRPNSRFAALQEKLAHLSPPDFGVMTATEFFLYESNLSPAGAQYTKLQRFNLSAGI